jgi:hypothetical protein
MSSGSELKDLVKKAKEKSIGFAEKNKTNITNDLKESVHKISE